MIGSRSDRIGLVASLARPGGNITGLPTSRTPSCVRSGSSCSANWCPQSTRWLVLNPAIHCRHRMRRVGKRRRAPCGQVGCLHRDPSARRIDAAFATIAGERPVRSSSAPTLFFATAIASSRWRSARSSYDLSHSSAIVDVGGLMSYGSQLFGSVSGRAAVYAGRILKATKPADLPVRAADQVRAGHQSEDRARCSASPFPRRCLQRADEVIE